MHTEPRQDKDENGIPVWLIKFWRKGEPWLTLAAPTRNAAYRLATVYSTAPIRVVKPYVKGEDV